VVELTFVRVGVHLKTICQPPLKERGLCPAWRVFCRDVLGNPSETIKLIVPAAIYTFQNNILYHALTYLDTVTYQVTYQLKILTTALFAVAILGKRLHAKQWVALVLLTIGVTIVQVNTG
jgi:UDP-sugar transporter A1/2/3